MKMGFKTTLVCLALGWAVMASAQPDGRDARNEATQRNAAAATDFQAHVLLDPAEDEAARQWALQEARAGAQRGDARVQYVLGSLYRLGRAHPARLVEHDPEQAAVLLSNAAVGGEILAMAGMAELLLAQGDARAAAVWAQVFRHYEEANATVRGERLDARRAYTASLLQRCMKALGDGDDLVAEIDADMAAFVRQHDAALQEALRARAAARAVRFRSADQQFEFLSYRMPPKIGTQPGMAVYLVGVDAEGGASRLLTVDSLPDQDVAHGLKRLAAGIRYDADAEAGGLRWELVPFVYDTRTIGFRERPR